MRHFISAFLTLFSLPIFAQTFPIPPQFFIETCVPVSDDTIRVCDGAGCDFNNDELQAALNAAHAGTVILLEAGAIYTGPFTLPEKPAAPGWITVRTAAPDAALPPADTRITPAYASVLPKIIAPPFLQAIVTQSRTHHWYFLGVEFASAAFSYNIVAIGNGETSEAKLPHDLTIDRVYAHGHPTQGSRRAFAGNGFRIALVNSWVSDCKEVGADSQAFCAWNGTGFKLVNNYLEGAGENVMFGGAIPSIHGLVPSDIEVRNNHFFKPLAWAIWSPEYAGTPWSVKNIFELKNAQRLWVQGNVLEQNWAHAQTGFAVLFTPRSEAGATDWGRVHDVLWEDNILRHTAGGFNTSGRDGNFPIVGTARILIRNNLIEDLDPAAWGNGSGRVCQVLGPVPDFTFEHNTVLNTGNTFLNADNPNDPNMNFIYRDNIVSYADYGAHGSGAGVGNGCFNVYFPQANFTHNAIADGAAGNGGTPANYPSGNFFPATMLNVGFMNYNGGQGGDYRLTAASPYRQAATDGTDIGANIDSLMLRTAGAIPGVFLACPDATSAVTPPFDDLPTLTAFPNPGSASFTVRGLTTEAVHSDAATKVRLEVWDAQACLRIVSFAGTTVATGGLPDGVYLIRVLEKNRVQVIKWVKRSR
ncbi:MAG: T9SS type A sorting domain-containing protein [Phycisphaerae bacterium]|nr:T9SS type A sorting domain-containing protein [Saprospiraceae bacterium]